MVTTRGRLWRPALALGIASFFVAWPQARVRSEDPKTPELIHQAPNPNPTAAYRWTEISLEATARDVDRVGARPTIISRTVQIALNAMYDAWAAYDEKAVGTRLGGDLRRPAAERTQANKEKAIAYATYRALLDVYPPDKEWIREQMKKMGYDPDGASTDRATPQGIGNAAAAAVIEYRHHDGANQLADELGTVPGGQPYSDYTYYKPINPPDRIIDPDRWQPIPFDHPKEPGKKVTPGFLTPQWYRVKPVVLERTDQFRPAPPPLVGSDELKKEVDENIRMNAHLTLEEKATVEFMRDGPRSTGQTGHWLRFAMDVSRRDHHDLDKDVKLFFVIANVAMDAFISCWETKRFYDSSRPWTLVHHYYKGQEIEGWGGPCKGVIKMKGEEWHPYSPYVFITPPFPGYTSGHATVSGASGKMLELFTGSDKYGAVAIRHPGELTEGEGCDGPRMQAHLGIPAKDAPTKPEERLPLPTFSATAEMAARSRALGGYHIPTDNNVGIEVGRKIAVWSWPKYQAYFDGTAKPSK
ncbi:vanadium-dependent haloperoxidase [bacterium]|nr:vanadium-dependent haloperoxidase [bacterium]